MSIDIVDIHRDINEAFDRLMKICLDLELMTCYESLKNERAFMSRIIDMYEDWGEYESIRESV